MATRILKLNKTTLQTLLYDTKNKINKEGRRYMNATLTN
jgi:hypothetical protein